MATPEFLVLLARWLRVCLVLTMPVACSLMVDTSDIDAGCPEDQKYCDNRCVSRADPLYGCGDTTCVEECRVENAVPECRDGACAVADCLFGYQDCDDQPGCETPVLADVQNCGGCLNQCEADVICRLGACMPRSSDDSGG